VPDAPADNNGVLEMREVMNLDLHARVAVLSDGASAAMRDAAPSADTVRWAWRAAGIPSIVLSRWSVDDAASGAMLKEMYVRLKDGVTPDAALQGARTAVRAGEETRAPYFWAGWMLVGR
jgi:CHAT domain-containing protein